MEKKYFKPESRPFLSNLRSTFKRSASETKLEYDTDMDIDHGLTDRQKDMLRLSWRCMTVDCRRMGGPGDLIFNRMIVLDPELQSVFGFNYCGTGNKILFEGHQHAFAKLIDFIITNLDSPPRINCKYLRDIGYKHKGTDLIGFHAGYLHIFSVAVLDTVASALNPSSSAYCISSEAWALLGSRNYGVTPADINLTKYRFECVAAWQKLVRYIKGQVINGYKSRAAAATPKAQSRISLCTLNVRDKKRNKNSMKTPDSEISLSASIRRNIFRRENTGASSVSSRSFISHGVDDDVFVHEQVS